MSDAESHEATADESADGVCPEGTQDEAIAEGAIFGDVGQNAPENGGGREPDLPAQGIDALLAISMHVQVVLGGCRLPIADLLKLGRGSVIELNRQIGEPVDVMVNGRLVARGDLLKLADNTIGVTLNEMIRDPSGETA